MAQTVTQLLITNWSAAYSMHPCRRLRRREVNSFDNHIIQWLYHHTTESAAPLHCSQHHSARGAAPPAAAACVLSLLPGRSRKHARLLFLFLSLLCFFVSQNRSLLSPQCNLKCISTHPKSRKLCFPVMGFLQLFIFGCSDGSRLQSRNNHHVTSIGRQTDDFMRIRYRFQICSEKNKMSINRVK